MQKHYWIATAALCVAPLFALAQQASTEHRSLQALSTIAPGSEPEVIAQSIIIFIPSVDTPLSTGAEDVYLKGRIVKVERGEGPGAIVMHAHTLWGSRKAGVPMRMYLMRAPDRDAYYPIYGTPLTDETTALLQPVNVPTLSVQVTSPLGQPVHTASLHGVPYTFGTEIRIPAGETQLRADLYFGVIPPGGEETLSWVNAAGKPGIREGMAPLLEGILIGEEATISTAKMFGQDPAYTFTGKEPPGMYLVFAFLVPAGSAPSDPANWLAVEMTPLVVE